MEINNEVMVKEKKIVRLYDSVVFAPIFVKTRFDFIFKYYTIDKLFTNIHAFCLFSESFTLPNYIFALSFKNIIYSVCRVRLLH